MTINNQEILRMLEFHKPKRELSAVIQGHQEKIKYIMGLQNPGETKDLITIAHEFKELVKLNEDELEDRYLTRVKQQYPDFKLSLEDGDIHASLYRYEGDTLPDFPPGLKGLKIEYCKNIEVLPDFPSSLKDLSIKSCRNLKTLPEFPSGIEYLKIEYYENLEALPQLPNLKKLGIMCCPNLGSIPEFPPGLDSLSIWDCENLEALPEFPSSLEKLTVEYCHKLNRETRDRIKNYKGKKL